MKMKENAPLPKSIRHGNDGRIDPMTDITPMYLTNNIVAKHPQQGNHVPQPLEENTILAKQEVDANEK